MVEFKCEVCDYVTNKKSSYTNHTKSKRHNKNLKKHNLGKKKERKKHNFDNDTSANNTIEAISGRKKCTYCDKSITYKNLSSHHKRCNDNPFNNDIVKLLEKQLKEKDKMLKEKDNTLNNLIALIQEMK